MAEKIFQEERLPANSWYLRERLEVKKIDIELPNRFSAEDSTKEAKRNEESGDPTRFSKTSDYFWHSKASASVLLWKQRRFPMGVFQSRYLLLRTNMKIQNKALEALLGQSHERISRLGRLSLLWGRMWICCILEKMPRFSQNKISWDRNVIIRDFLIALKYYLSNSHNHHFPKEKQFLENTRIVSNVRTALVSLQQMNQK